MNTARALGVAVSVAVSGFAALVAAAASRERVPPPPPERVPAAAVTALMQPEVQLAESLGMTVAERGDDAITVRAPFDASWSRVIDVGAGECVAVVVGVSGWQTLSRLAIQMGNAPAEHIVGAGETPLSWEGNGPHLVGHVQWCDPVAARRVVVAESQGITRTSPSEFTGGRVQWVLLRGPWSRVGGPTRLTRGRLSSEALSAMPASIAVAEAQRLVPEGARPIGPPLTVHAGAVRLIPSTTEALRALYPFFVGEPPIAVNPRLDPEDIPSAPFATGLPLGLRDTLRSLSGEAEVPPAHEPVVEVGRNDFRRALALLDPRGLRAPCVGALLTRMRYAHEAALWSITTPGATGDAVSTAGGAAFVTRCADEGPALFVTRDDDRDPWRAQVYAVPRPAAP
ncbi:MAG: hypothetical protein R3A52_30600 [Polyangiales bacterium]